MHTTFEHTPDCPVRSDDWAKGQYEMHAVTAGQEGCPFCDMVAVRHDGEIDFQALSKKIIANLGRKGGLSRSDAKRKASAENGKLGGRPRKVK